jgi:hypothetical protein
MTTKRRYLVTLTVAWYVAFGLFAGSAHAAAPPGPAIAHPHDKSGSGTGPTGYCYNRTFSYGPEDNSGVHAANLQMVANNECPMGTNWKAGTSPSWSNPEHAAGKDYTYCSGPTGVVKTNGRKYPGGIATANDFSRWFFGAKGYRCSADKGVHVTMSVQVDADGDWSYVDTSSTSSGHTQALLVDIVRPLDFTGTYHLAPGHAWGWTQTYSPASPDGVHFYTVKAADKFHPNGAGEGFASTPTSKVKEQRAFNGTKICYRNHGGWYLDGKQQYHWYVTAHVKDAFESCSGSSYDALTYQVTYHSSGKVTWSMTNKEVDSGAVARLAVAA